VQLPAWLTTRPPRWSIVAGPAASAARVPGRDGLAIDRGEGAEAPETAFGVLGSGAASIADCASLVDL